MASAPSSHRDPVTSAIQPVLESLESRTLLSVSLASGVLRIEGTPEIDKVVVKPHGQDQIRIADNGEVHYFARSDVRRIVFHGGDGDDSLRVKNYGGSGDARIIARGGNGDDVIATGDADDKVFGDAGDDVLSGGRGDNHLNGGAGNDTLVARDGDDLLLGSLGADQIIGGTGKDAVRTGAGADSDSHLKPKFPIITYTLDPTGYTPRMHRLAYGLGSLDDPNYDNRGQGQAIAIVGAYDLPNIYQDMKKFSREFELPQMSKKQLRVVNLAPKKRRLVDEEWYGEAMLDAQWAHAIAPKARIYMVQAATNAWPDIQAAVEKAKRILNNGFGGGVISMSLGSDNDAEFERVFNASFRGPDTRYISFIVSAGDTGGTNSSPSTSPNAVSVGGTALYLDQYGNRVAGFTSVGVDPLTNLDVWGGDVDCGDQGGIELQDPDFERNIIPGGEKAWWNGGGGPSNVWDRPDYQENRNLPPHPLFDPTGSQRATPDISWNGDPQTGVPIFNSLGSGGQSGWGTTGGTSAGAPQFAAVVALANQLRAEKNKNPVGSTLLDRIYRIGGRGADQAFVDIGNPDLDPNFFANPVYHGSGPLTITPCTDFLFANPTLPGWDYATGWGSPNASALIPALADRRVPLTSGRIRISGVFTDDLEWIGFTGATRAGGYGTITVPSMTSTRLFRSTQTPGGGPAPVQNSLFMVDFYGQDSQDGRADRNGWAIVVENGQVTEQQLNQGTGSPIKLYKHGKAVQGIGFVTITEIDLGDDGGGGGGGGGGGQPDPDEFIVRTVPVRFVGKVGKKGQISGDYWAIAANGDRLKREFDPDSNLSVMLVRGKFRWD